MNDNINPKDSLSVRSGLSDSETTSPDSPEVCVCCGSHDIDPAVYQCSCQPLCDNCIVYDESSPQVFVGRTGYAYSRRGGRWFLDTLDRCTGRDGILGELKAPPADLTQPPRSRQNADGYWIWDCEFTDGHEEPACDQWGRPYICA